MNREYSEKIIPTVMPKLASHSLFASAQWFDIPFLLPSLIRSQFVRSLIHEHLADTSSELLNANS